VVDHQSTISPQLSAAPPPTFTPDVALEARGFREGRALATTGDATTGDATSQVRCAAAAGLALACSDADLEHWNMGRTVSELGAALVATCG